MSPGSGNAMTVTVDKRREQTPVRSRNDRRSDEKVMCVSDHNWTSGLDTKPKVMARLEPGREPTAGETPR
jgi:hypothetical protein